MSIAIIVKRRFYMIFCCFAMEDYVKIGENFKFMWSWKYRAKGPLGQTFL